MIELKHIKILLLSIFLLLVSICFVPKLGYSQNNGMSHSKSNVEESIDFYQFVIDQYIWLIKKVYKGNSPFFVIVESVYLDNSHKIVDITMTYTENYKKLTEYKESYFYKYKKDEKISSKISS